MIAELKVFVRLFPLFLFPVIFKIQEVFLRVISFRIVFG